jgi:translation elongation factor EF-1alpha
MTKEKVAEIFQFWEKYSAAGLNMTGSLKMGDKISIEGPETSFEQEVTSMQIDRNPVQTVKAGDSVGLEVTQPVKPGDTVYKI